MLQRLGKSNLLIVKTERLSLARQCLVATSAPLAALRAAFEAIT
jgi:hypothetical protein